MIKNKNNGRSYVGKSIDYMARLKQHTHPSNNKTLIDNALNIEGLDAFEYYLLGNYIDLEINFFNRKLETIIEHRLIKKHNSNFPTGYNQKYYGHI